MNDKFFAWANATPILGSDDRKDCDGRIIRWTEYGQKSAFGWEIDHKIPKAMGGSDGIDNLRARHWFGNRSAGGLLGGILGDMPNNALLANRVSNSIVDCFSEARKNSLLDAMPTTTRPVNALLRPFTQRP